MPIFSDPRDTEIAPGIAVNPARRFGKPTLAGTRITVAEVLSKLKAGWTIDEILHAWPHLTREQIVQAIDYAEQLVAAAALPRGGAGATTDSSEE